MNKQTGVALMALLIVGFIGFCSFKIAEWKVFSNSYLSFVYPDNYVLYETEEDDTFDVSCELEDSDNDVSIAYISVTKLGDIEEIEDIEDIDEILRTSVEYIRTDLLNDDDTYEDMKCGSIEQVLKGSNGGFGFSFTGTASGVSIQGDCFMGVTGTSMLSFLTVADSEPHLTQLNSIVNSIEVK